MVNRHPRRLVIDADVASSAGVSEHPISSACRKFLKTMLNVGHHVVMTDEIKKEWDAHMSQRYSRIWLTRMLDSGRVDRIEKEKERNENLRNIIDEVIPRDQRDTVSKDVHLIEAAIAADRLVASQDERARRAFGHASANVSELKQIVWVNPTKDDEKPIDWLRDGARAEESRQLGV